MAGNGGLSLSHVQWELLAGSPPLLVWRGAGMEVGRSEPDGQRGLVLQLRFFYSTKFR